jgi:hypothetical protein
MEEAKRFLKVCEAFKKVAGGIAPGEITHLTEDRGACTKEAGTVKRASMDVTRAMADLRLDR